MESHELSRQTADRHRGKKKEVSQKIVLEDRNHRKLNRKLDDMFARGRNARSMVRSRWMTAGAEAPSST